MRMIFGLASLLVTLGVIFVIIQYAAMPSLQQASTLAPQLQQQSGQTAGVGAAQSISMDPQFTNGRLDSMLVSTIDLRGPMSTYFGLRPQDRIVQVGPQNVRDIGDAETAKALILEAYQRRQPLVVLRGTERLTLPQPGASQQQPANPVDAMIRRL